MEFTFNGIVRESFGFYNPNHAGAFLAMFLPFVWYLCFYSKRVWLKIIGVFLNFAIITAIAMTFSRSAILIAIIELFLFAILYKKLVPKYYKYIIVSAVIAIGIMAIVGVFARIKVDEAMTNRIDIWIAGIKLLAANPIGGVGLGNSGSIASNFLLNDNITCRTLVNSHLTILVEFGMLMGGLWTIFIIYALIVGYRKKLAFIAFVGLTIAGVISTIFDWGILTNFVSFGELGLTNFVMSYWLLTAYVTLGIYLVLQKFSPKGVFIALGIYLLFIAISLFFYSKTTPKISDNLICLGNYQENLLLHDRDLTVKELCYFAKNNSISDDYAINITPISLEDKILNNTYKNIYLFGNATELIDKISAKNIFIVNPTEFFADSINNIKVKYEILNF